MTPDYEWAYEPVTMLHQAGIINGYDNNVFKPERNITRAEFITMAAKAMGLKSTSAELSFKDKNEIPDWASPSMQAAVKAGLIDGYEDGSIRPNQPISRSEIVAILVKGFQLPVAADYSLKYTDRNEIPKWAVDYVRTVASKGLVDGYEDGRFAPNNQAKRSEVASILYKAILMN
ncbi:S-layer homology domain-containing protein [Paenibacillus sp. P25]|nr:S-layer homology domain-containing protein [Paenibacillus sp. P25]